MKKVIKIIWQLTRYFICFIGVAIFLMVAFGELNINIGEKRGQVFILLWIISGFILFSAIKGVLRRLKPQKRRRTSIPKKIQREVWIRDKGRCVKCKSQENLEFDHIIPLSKGGSNTARNIQLLCENCNRKKSNKI